VRNSGLLDFYLIGGFLSKDWKGVFKGFGLKELLKKRLKGRLSTDKVPGGRVLL
jgi:hypothetical protein